MKRLIDNSGGFKTYFELRPYKNPSHDGWQSLIITTVWEGARGEVEEHKQYELSLDAQSLANFKEFIKDAL